MRVVRNAIVTVVTDPFDAPPSAATATAVRLSDGATLAAPVATISGTRVLVALTTAHTSQLDRVTVAVSATVAGVATPSTVVVDVVGGDYFPLAAIRQEAGLADSGRFPDAILSAYRDGLIDYVERASRRSFVPRFDVERHPYPFSRAVQLHHTDVTAVRTVSVDGVTVTGPHTLLFGSVKVDGWPAGDVVEVGVEHGTDAPPGRIITEMLRCLRRDLLARNAQAPSDMLWETVEGNTVRYSTSDYTSNRPTGVLGLDAAIAAYRAPSGVA